MKKARFTQDQIIGILKEHQASATDAQAALEASGVTFGDDDSVNYKSEVARKQH